MKFDFSDFSWSTILAICLSILSFRIVGDPPWGIPHGGSPMGNPPWGIPHRGTPMRDPSWGIPMGDPPSHNPRAQAVTRIANPSLHLGACLDAVG